MKSKKKEWCSWDSWFKAFDSGMEDVENSVSDGTDVSPLYVGNLSSI